MNSQASQPSEALLRDPHPPTPEDINMNIATRASDPHKNYTVKIFTTQLGVTTHKVDDPVVDGRDIAELTGIRSADDHIVLQVLQPNRATEERRLEEKFALDALHDNVFFVSKADGTSNVVIDGLRVAWFSQPITAQVIRYLAGKNDEFEVFQLLPDQPDKLITGGEEVSLRGDGVEHFRTERVKATVTVYLADVPFEIRVGNYTTEDLKQALGVAENYVLDLVGNDGAFIELQPRHHLSVKDGMKFVAYLPTGHSA